VTDAAVTEAAEPAAPPAKRKPGRPRKVVAVAPVTDAAVTEAAEPAAPPAKRKPGRPRKVVAVDGVAVDPAPGAPETSQTVSMAEYESDTDHGDDNGNYWMSDGTADVTDSSPGSQTSAPASGRFSYAEIIRQLKLDHTLPPNRSFQPLTTIPATLSPEDLISSDDVYNRELSWLDFNWRVLHEALDPRTPLLERLKFIAITSSNLDEFFSKRVGGLKRMRAAGVANLTLDGWAPDVQLQLISKAVQQMVETESACLHEDILPALAQHGVRIVSYDELDSAQKERLKAYYLKEVYPILTPLAVDPGHPFPFISHLSLSLAVLLRDTSSGDVQFARVKVPQTRPRWVPIDFPLHFVPLEQIITANLDSLFKGMEVVAVYPFRVTRNADIARNEEEADDLLEMINEELRERRFAPVVRLEVDASIPPEWLALLQGQLHLDNTDTYPIRGLMRRVDLFALADINLPHLKYEPWTPFTPPKFSGLSSKARPSEIFSVIRQGDLLVHHPYQSFQSSTQLFIESAARDPQVLAIKQTLYRTSEQSAVIAALIQAAERGKQVAALVEVKARFDEAKNIEWARKLEDAGCHVTYGLVGLKTHCKVSLAIRQEEDGLRAYYHIGTGNYNAKTAAVYTDFGFFSCNPEIAADLMDLFNHLTGYSYQTDYRKLLVAPVNMRQRFGQLIDQEISHALAGKRARIIAKMNGLDDPFLVRKLYEASQAGVSIDLIVRGNCRIRPGIPGISDNIRLTSVIGRNLEHHRIFYFENDGTPHFSIGSADWMRRNLSSRVEAAVPIEDPRLQEYLLMVLHNSLQDHRHAWEMLPDGRYRQRQPGVGATALEAGGVQNYLMQHTRLSSSPTLAP
jgi:polyphosphate kinase